MIRRVCSWCSKDMGKASKEFDHTKTDITHSICEDCRKKVEEDIGAKGMADNKGPDNRGSIRQSKRDVRLDSHD